MKQKHNYNIEIIDRGQEDGLTMQNIADQNGWPLRLMERWIERNFPDRYKEVRIRYNIEKKIRIKYRNQQEREKYD